jgi:thiol-disulfide isomerase/thioredoxin
MKSRFTIRMMVLLVSLTGWSLAGCFQAAMPTTPSRPTEEPFYAPDFTLTALDGTSYTLSELRGQWVLVSFWATWCEPCKDELPMFQQLTESHPDNVTVLAINLREETSLITAFVEDYGLTFPILMNPDDATVLAYQVLGLPQTLIVNPDGEVVFRRFGPITEEDLEILN